MFVSLPTGYGKSIIYAILSLVYDKMTGKLFKEMKVIYITEFVGKQGSIVLCISPLTTIMMDQKQKFAAWGIKTEFVGEEQVDHTVTDCVMKGQIQLVYQP